MMNSTSLIITSIASPNEVLKKYANECAKRKINFILIGDVSSPKKFNLPGCRFLGMEEQKKTGLRIVKKLPERHYSRKNIGYLLAHKNKSELIIETDDDNFPKEKFWEKREEFPSAFSIKNSGWINVYSYFTDKHIWPRGMPLECLQNRNPALGKTTPEKIYCPIQQGLADENPDVDAVFRLVEKLPFTFEKKVRVALGKNTWSPFSSQNTTWLKKAFPLMYLPSYASFRMTDIWRSFIAQRIAWANDWSVLFHEPTVTQTRNDHNLLKDFEDEIPGYLQNHKITMLLQSLKLKKGEKYLSENLFTCYHSLVQNKILPEKELFLVDDWINDLI